MTLPEIEDALNKIKAEVESPHGDAHGAADKLATLSAMDGLSCECLKELKKAVLHRQGDVVKKHSGIPATELKMLVESELWLELALLTYAERLNAAIHHGMDGLRTIISLHGKELDASKYQQG